MATEVYATGRRGGSQNTDEAVEKTILDAIWRWTEQYGEPPTLADWEPSRARRTGQAWRAERWQAGGWPTVPQVRRQFTTMSAAIRAAGLTPRRSPTRTRRHLARPEEVLEAIIAWHRRFGEPPGMADWDPSRARSSGQTWRIARYYDGDWPSIPTVCKHFGTLSHAVAAAGLRPRPRGQRAASGRRADRPADPGRDGPEQILALRVRSVAQARTADDPKLLAACLHDLSVAAAVWADELRTGLS